LTLFASGCILLLESKARENTKTEKNLKNFQKALDKLKAVWYNKYNK
jgi:hypothetical protein